VKLFHRHTWKAIAVNHLERYTHGRFENGLYIPVPNPPKRHETEILQRCECGELQTRSLVGLWRLEEVTAPVSDKQFLKEAGVKL
jgi:hypothetical protein